jgi:hypothetical protein
VPTRRWSTILLLTRVAASWRWCAVLLLTLLWLSVPTLLRVLTRRWSTILTLSWRWLTVLSALRRLTILTLRRLAVLPTWRRCAVLLRLTVTLLRRCATVLAWRRSSVATGCGVVGLLVLEVVAAVDSTKEKLDDPEVGSEVLRWVGARHLFLLVLEV